MFGSSKITCQGCDREIDKSNRFCPACGTPTETRMGKCPYCNKKINLDTNNCSECGRKLPTMRDPVVDDRVWRASLDDFAVRLNPEDVGGKFYKHIEIQMGQEAIILVDGRSQEDRRGPGTYTVKTLFDNFLNLGHGHRVRALIVQSGPMTIEFALNELRTADSYEISGGCTVAVAVANSATFFSHVMRQQSTFTTADLRRFLFNQVKDAVQEVVGKENLRTLATGMRMKENIATAVERHLAQTLADSGLSVSEVRTAEFTHPRLEKMRRQWEEDQWRQQERDATTERMVKDGRDELGRSQQIRDVDMDKRRDELARDRKLSDIETEKRRDELGRQRQKGDLDIEERHDGLDQQRRQEKIDQDEKAGDLDHRQALWETEAATYDQGTREESTQVDVYEARAQTWERLRQAMSTEKANEIRSEEDFADFLAEIDERKVLRQEEKDVLMEEYASRGEDRQAARAQIVYLAGLERDYERKKVELSQRTNFTLEGMNSTLQVERQKLTDAGLLDEQRWQLEQDAMRRDAERAAQRRSEQAKVQDYEHGVEEKDLTHQQKLDIAKTEHEMALAAIRSNARRTEAQKEAEVDVELARYKVQKDQILHGEEIRRKQVDFEQETGQGKETFDEGIRRQEKAAETSRKIQKQEDDDDMELAGKAVDLLDKMKQNKLSAEEIARRIAREDDLERSAVTHQQILEQDASDHQIDMDRRDKDLVDKDLQQQYQLADKDLELKHDLAKLQARAEMSAEALVSLSGPEQAKVIADLKESEALQGMSDDAVLAMAAAKSPHVAKALEERFKATQVEKPDDSAELKEERAEVKALYDRMFEDMREDKDKEAELRERTEQRYQDMFNKALDSQKEGMVDIAKTTSHPPQTPPTPPAAQAPNVIVVPGGGGSSDPQIIQSGGGAAADPGQPAGKVQVCPNCSKDMAVGIKFCTNCGHQFHK